MKKILSALVVFFVASCVSAFACSQSNETVTGAACSIKDLKELQAKSAQPLEKGQMVFDKENKQENDLRPVNIYQGTIESGDNMCLFGPCLRSRLGK